MPTIGIVSLSELLQLGTLMSELFSDRRHNLHNVINRVVRNRAKTTSIIGHLKQPIQQERLPNTAVAMNRENEVPPLVLSLQFEVLKETCNLRLPANETRPLTPVDDLLKRTRGLRHTQLSLHWGA